VNSNEFVGRSIRPWWQLDVVHGLPCLATAQRKVLGVHEASRLVEQIRDHLLDIAAVCENLVPGGRETEEQAVCMIKALPLQLPRKRCKRLEADQVPQNDGR
jgi:hypothetical protein